MADPSAEALVSDPVWHSDFDQLPRAAGLPMDCFHCGEPIPADVVLSVSVAGIQRAMCCAGCAAAANLIEEAGLSDFYQHRTRASPRIEDLPPAVQLRMKALDHPRLRQQFEVTHDNGDREVTLILERTSCPACLWLIERVLSRQAGVRSVAVNHSSRRARLRLGSEASLVRIITAIQQLGYDAQPFQPSAVHAATERERSWLLRRLGVAWVLGMQVMMVTGAFYFDSDYVAPAHRHLLDGLNLLLTTPVVFYSGQGFLQAAWRGLRHGVFNMDLSVSLGVLLAFLGSAWATVSGQGTTYFDSVVMFVSLLLGARYLEFMARKRAQELNERLLRRQPTLATRVLGRHDVAPSYESVAAVDLCPGDEILVRPGEIIPADAMVISGISSTDESLLTGESRPVGKAPNARVIGGSINMESPLHCRVERVGAQTLFAGIVATMERALAERPRLATLAEQASQWFVLGVLLSAVLTGIACYLTGAPWFERVLAVLVITCPCALALATPAAVTNAIQGLMQRGVLIRRAQALETLATVTHVVFDKTGTLTHGDLRLTDTRSYGTLNNEECLRIAAALESHSEHPLARALLRAWGQAPPASAEVMNIPGSGIEGMVEGRHWYLGDEQFVRARTSRSKAQPFDTATGVHTSVWLADDDRLQCQFQFGDRIRSEASDLVEFLHQRGIRTTLMSGDRSDTVSTVMRATGIESCYAELGPEEKLARLRGMQRQGAIVMMVGDGINDAPVLGGAQVSVAMGVGADLAKANADIVLMRDDLRIIKVLLQQAERTRTVIRGNIAWAIAYNALALPAAMVGWINPLLAALGMSSSSLLVVLNAWRLRRAST